jgi:flagellar biosynthesis protein FliR
MTTTVPFFTVEPAHVQLLFLAVIRLSGLLLVAPPFNHPIVPVQVKVAVAFSLTLAVWTSLTPPPIASSPLMLAGLAAGEAVVGLAMGFVARMALAAASFAAEMVSIQMGFGIAGVLDPALGSQVSVLTYLYDWTALALFLALDGHHLVFGAAIESFRVVPIGGAAVAAGSAAILPLGGRMFTLALALVAPTLGVLFLTNLVMVLGSRAIPQLNLLAVGLPITILLGLSVLMINLDLTSGVIAREMQSMETTLIGLLRSFAGGR